MPMSLYAFAHSSKSYTGKARTLSSHSKVMPENIPVPFHCWLSKYHSQKPESTRRTIFNRDSTLQLIVQISSGNVNSSVRAKAKTHGRTPVSIELPRGRYLSSDACIS